MQHLSVIKLLLLLVILLPSVAKAFETKAKQAILVDLTTHTVLLDKNADERMPPSSMSKLMTTYMIFDGLRNGSLELSDKLRVSEKAWRKGGSKMFVELGKQIALEDLLRGIIIQSGNDACIVVAEHLAGSEEAFANMMNEKAKEIGLVGSNFVNATGWPDPEHYMTARDLYVLALHIMAEFPQYYPFYSEKSFTYHNIKQPNRNVLLHRNLGVDGMKTGHTQAAGYGIVVSAKNDEGRRLLLVINGMESERERADEAARLIRYGFRNFDMFRIGSRGEVVETAKTWMGDSQQIGLIGKRGLNILIPKGKKEKVRLQIEYNGPIPAPIKEGQEVAELVVYLEDEELKRLPLVADRSVEKLSGVQRIIPNLVHLITGK
jgi:D-alanyl-D-alanine carboxypeptidase (penicillin-binding protein 5/6)